MTKKQVQKLVKKKFDYHHAGSIFNLVAKYRQQEFVPGTGTVGGVGWLQFMETINEDTDKFKAWLDDQLTEQHSTHLEQSV